MRPAGSGQGNGAASVPRWLVPVRFTVEGRDRHRWAGYVALAGLAAGVLMAVFGLPPVDIHGPVHYLGLMDPGCGGTRSVWAAMNGDFATSWEYNPLGIPLLAGAALVLLRLVAGLAGGRWINVEVRSWPTLAVVAAVLFAALTVRQQMRADLLATEPGPYFPLGIFLNALPLLVIAAWVIWRRRAARR